MMHKQTVAKIKYRLKNQAIVPSIVTIHQSSKQANITVLTLPRKNLKSMLNHKTTNFS